MKKRIILTSAAATLCLLLAVFCFAKIIAANLEYESSSESYQEIVDLAVIADGPESKYLTIDHAALTEQNPDYIGWINIPGAGVSYPVVQSADNNAYLHTTFDGAGNKAGSIFLDYRSNSTFGGFNAIIYGHHMRDGSMFAALKDYMTADFCKEYPTIHIYTPHSRILVYSVFSAQKTYTSSDVFSFQFSSDLDKAMWLDSMLEQSVYDFGVVVDESAKTITLVTCVGGADKEARYVVVAARTEIIEINQ